MGDGSYAAIDLIAHAQTLPQPGTLIARLRLDARLFDPPLPQPPSKRVPKPKKGPRQTRLDARLTDPTTVWQPISVPWYGGESLALEYVTATAL